MPKNDYSLMASIGKKVASTLHLWLGLASGLVVLVVALTGSLLVFEEELEPLLSPRFYTVHVPAGSPRQPLDKLVATATATYPGKKLSRVIVEPDADRTVIVGLQQSNNAKDVLSVALDPYTGAIVDTRAEEQAFFSVVLRLHRYLCLGDVGKTITGLSCSIFLVIMLTGLVLWWPKRKNRKQRFSIKWGASVKRLNWDLHAVGGFYVLPFVFLIALTGLVWSYKWVNGLLFYAFDGKPPAKREAPANLSAASAQPGLSVENLYADINRQLPYRGTLTLVFPEKDSLSITASKKNEDAAIANIVDFLYFDAHTGALVKKRLYEQDTRGFKVRRLIFPIHTGSLLGWPTQLIALLAALITATLPITGFYIWWGRQTKTKRPKVRPGAALARASPPAP